MSSNSSSSSSSAQTYNLGATPLDASPAIVQIMFTFAGIALYNTLELVCLLLFTFNRYRGLYFWSLLLTSLGIVPYTLFLLFKFFAVLPAEYNLLDVAFLDVGWQLMVTGQSVVMYSRLHLLVHDVRVLRGVRYMIVANWFVSNIPTTILVFLSNTADAPRSAGVYAVWERLQLVLYFCQEVIISLVYVKAIFDMGEGKSVWKWTSWRKVMFGKRSGVPWDIDPVVIMRHLAQMNFLVIALDISLLVVEFAGYYSLQVLYKGALYSVKLKIEFWILNQLTAMASRKLKSSNEAFGGSGGYPTLGTLTDPTAIPLPTSPTAAHRSSGTSQSHTTPGTRPPAVGGAYAREKDDVLAAQQQQQFPPPTPTLATPGSGRGYAFGAPGTGTAAEGDSGGGSDADGADQDALRMERWSIPRWVRWGGGEERDVRVMRRDSGYDWYPPPCAPSFALQNAFLGGGGGGGGGEGAGGAGPASALPGTPRSAAASFRHRNSSSSAAPTFAEPQFANGDAEALNNGMSQHLPPRRSITHGGFLHGGEGYGVPRVGGQNTSANDGLSTPFSTSPAESLRGAGGAPGEGDGSAADGAVPGDEEHGDEHKDEDGNGMIAPPVMGSRVRRMTIPAIPERDDDDDDTLPITA